MFDIIKCQIRHSFMLNILSKLYNQTREFKISAVFFFSFFMCSKKHLELNSCQHAARMLTRFL